MRFREGIYSAKVIQLNRTEIRFAPGYIWQASILQVSKTLYRLSLYTIVKFPSTEN